jgi:hypothetical protein
MFLTSFLEIPNRSKTFRYYFYAYLDIWYGEWPFLSIQFGVSKGGAFFQGNFGYGYYWLFFLHRLRIIDYYRLPNSIYSLWSMIYNIMEYICAFILVYQVYI